MTLNNTPANADQITTTNSTEDQTTPSPAGDQPLVSQTHIEIYTDGSCIGNPGPGGWGAVILRRDASGQIIKDRERSGHETGQTTNNRMEMTAACVGLESLGRVTDEPIIMRCDANIIPNAMNGGLANWKGKGWKKSDGQPPKNRDLWERLEAATEGRNVKWEWVRGHDGDEFNERADQLAYDGSRKAEKIIKGR